MVFGECVSSRNVMPLGLREAYVFVLAENMLGTIIE